MCIRDRDNNGVKYLLTVIDVFSKYGWMIPLKTKTGVEVAGALKEIFKQRKPGLLWTDKGIDFFNRHVKGLVDLYTTENEEKSSVAERWNRTMKERMFKYFTANNTRRYIDILDHLVDKYNYTIQSSIKMTPVQATERKNENKVYKNLYLESHAAPVAPPPPIFFARRRRRVVDIGAPPPPPPTTTEHESAASAVLRCCCVLLTRHRGLIYRHAGY